MGTNYYWLSEEHCEEVNGNKELKEEKEDEIVLTSCPTGCCPCFPLEKKDDEDERFKYVPKDEHAHDLRIRIGRTWGLYRYCEDCGIVLETGGIDIRNDKEDEQRCRDTDPYHEMKECPCCKTPAEKCGHAPLFAINAFMHIKRAKILAYTDPDKKVIVDEYGSLYTASQFLEVVENRIFIHSVFF